MDYDPKCSTSAERTLCIVWSTHLFDWTNVIFGMTRSISIFSLLPSIRTRMLLCLICVLLVFIMPMLANARISIRYETREWPKKAAPNNLSYGIIAFIFQSNLLAFFLVWTKMRDQKSNTKNFPVSIPFSPGYLKHKIMKTFLTSWSMKFFVWNKLPKLHWNIFCSGSQIGLERFRITVLPKIGFFDQAAYKCCKCSLSNSLAASNHLAQK